jgi:capsular polysaccharide biosynthesis protein
MLNLVLLRMLETYFRRRWLYLLPIVAMVIAAVVYMLLIQPKYVAKGVLYVQNQSFLASLTSVRVNNPSWWITPAQLSVNEINELLQTDAFVRAIIEKTDLEAYMGQGTGAVESLIKKTRKSISASPLGDNQVQIIASFEDPEIAYQLVNAVISGYSRWQINAQRVESQVAQDFFSELIQTYEAELDLARQEMRDYLEANPLPLRGDRSGTEQLELARLQGMIDLLSQRYANALEKEENARLATAQVESDARQSNILIDAPKQPDKPEVSKRKLALQAGLFVMAGLLLSVGSVIGAAVLDRSFLFPLDVHNRLSLPVLAVVPDVKEKTRWRQKKKDVELDQEKKTEIPEAVPADGIGMAPVDTVKKETDVEVKEAVW